MEYHKFIASKQKKDVASGFVRTQEICGQLFGHQKAIVDWALRRGRAAIFANTGLGKTAMQCEWARHVVDHTKGCVLIVAPLAVSVQTIGEAAKFGIHVEKLNPGADVSGDGIHITNYEQLHKVDLDQFVGIVLDESSILKSRDGKTRNDIINRCQSIPYRPHCR